MVRFWYIVDWFTSASWELNTFSGGDSVESCIFSICFSNTTACRHCKLWRCCCYQLWIGQWSRKSNYTCIMCLDEKWGNYGHIWGTCIRQCFWMEKFASICIELTFYFTYKRKVVLSHYCSEVRRQRMCQWLGELRVASQSNSIFWNKMH